MLLHSGYADHPPGRRFDIVVADPICTLTTFGKETVVSESEKRTTTTDDVTGASSRCWIAQTFAQRITKICHFRAAHWGCLATRAAVLSHRQKLRNKISFCRIWLGIYDWALIVDHQRHTVSLLSHNDVNARRAWLESQQFSPQEDFTLTSDWQPI